MSSLHFKIWLATTLLLAVLIAPFLARGDQSDRQLKERHAQQLARLSDSQRNRLLQNEAQYLAASTTARDALRNFHIAIEKDRRQGGELTAVMSAYDAWIRTIKRSQREQLASTSDPQERIALMKEIVRSQQEWVARRGLSSFGPGGDRPHFGAPPLLNEKASRAVMDALREAANVRLKPEQQAELEKLSGLKRDFRLLQILKETGTGLTPKPLLEEPPHEFKTVAEHLDQYVEDERTREFITGRPVTTEGENPPRRLGTPEARLVVLVYQSMMAELSRLRRASHLSVDETRLRDYLNQLPLDRQYELLSLDTAEFQNELRNQYLDGEGLSGLPSRQDFRELFGWGFLRGGMGGPDRRPSGFRGDRDTRPPRGPAG